MESLTANFIQFTYAISKFYIFGTETGHKAMSTPNFEILPHFLRSQVFKLFGQS